MKTTAYFSAILLAVSTFAQGDLFAQPGEQKDESSRNEHRTLFRKGHAGQQEEGNIPNLSDEQKGKIKDFRLSFLKEVQPLRNHLNELKAKQKTLATADKPDLKSINANIDEITSTQNQIMKLRASFRQQVRALLTDEQRIYFDMHGKAEMKNGRHFMGRECRKDNN
jgi:Spy/CpxP family protein refolding chaperone